MDDLGSTAEFGRLCRQIGEGLHVKWFVIGAALLVATVRYLAPQPETPMPLLSCPKHTRSDFLEARVRLLAWAETEMEVLVKRLDDDTLSAPARVAAWHPLQQRRLLWQARERSYTPWRSCSDPCGGR